MHAQVCKFGEPGRLLGQQPPSPRTIFSNDRIKFMPSRSLQQRFITGALDCATRDSGIAVPSNYGEAVTFSQALAHTQLVVDRGF